MALPIPVEPRMSVAWVDVPEVPLAAVHFKDLTIDDIASAFDGAFPAILTALEQAGVALGDAPAIAIYHGNPMETFDLRVAVEVETPLTAEIEVGEYLVVPSDIPAGEYATISHVGSYDDLGASWEHLAQDVRGGGAETEPVWIEVYVSDPSSTDPAELRTDLFVEIIVSTAY